MSANRIEKRLSELKDRNEKAFITYITAGLPSMEKTADIIKAQESTDIALLLPENLQKELEPFVQGELAKTLGKGVEATFSKKVSGGFRIGPRDGSYFISLTDETFKSLIANYLRPVTRKFLFEQA